MNSFFIIKIHSFIETNKHMFAKSGADGGVHSPISQYLILKVQEGGAGLDPIGLIKSRLLQDTLSMFAIPLLMIVFYGITSLKSQAVSHDKTEPTNQPTNHSAEVDLIPFLVWETFP